MAESLQHLLTIPPLLITWLTFTFVGLISYVIQIRMAQQGASLLAYVRHCFPFELWKTKSARADVALYLVTTALVRITRGLSPVLVVLVSVPVSTWLEACFPAHVPHPPGYLATLGCAALLFVTSELSDYVTHYVSHRVPFMWELHKIHHSALFLNPLTTKRGHPLDYLFPRVVSPLFAGVPAGLIGFWYGMSLVDTFLLSSIAVKVAVLLTFDPLKHSHYPLRFGWLEHVLISPHMHQVHHSSLEQHWDRNYGTNLSIFDWLFGTAYKPKQNEDIRYGIYGLDGPGLAEYSSFHGAIVRPVGRMLKLLRTRRGALRLPGSS